MHSIHSQNLIFHIDVNSAFLSWTAVELLKKDPSFDIRTIPSIIGGDEKSRHGIVLAKSVSAKKFGIRTAEPVASAFKKCPFLHMEPPDHALYHRRSQEMMRLLHTYTSDIEQVSVDECYMSFSPISHRFPSALEAARSIADRIRNELGFTVNIGIAPNRLLAKMASDFEKPDKVHTLFESEIPEKMWPLPVGDLFTVGKSSADRLEQLGIRTIGELANTDPAFLAVHFKSHGKTMWEFANGIDRTPLQLEHQDAKGIGNSTTLPSDVKTTEEAYHILLGLSEQVAFRLRKAHQIAQTVTVEIKYNTFVSCSRQTQLHTPASTSGMIYDCACRLFDELWNGTPIRLLGIRTTKLLPEDAPIQLSLFDTAFSLTEDVPAFSDTGSHSSSLSGKISAHSSHDCTGSERVSVHSSHGSSGSGKTSVHTVSASGTSSVPAQKDLEKQKKLEQAMDNLRQKFGKNAVQRGSLFNFSLTQCESKRKI